MKVWRMDFSCIVALMIFVFAASLYLPISSKFSHNIYYVGVGLPVLYWLFTGAPSFRSLVNSFGWLFAMFFGFAILMSTHDISKLKSVIYLSILFFSCLLLMARKNLAKNVFGCFSVLSILLFCYVLIDWLLQRQVAGIWLRERLWGQAANPVYASMLVMSSLVFIWLFYAEKWFEVRARWMFFVGFSVMLILCVLCGAVFQSRSAMLGVALFLLVYLVRRKYIFIGCLAVACVLMLLLSSGVSDALLERGLSYRLTIWQDALQRLVSECSVWFGCGASDYRFLGRFYHPHSSYVSVVYSFGLVGGVMFGIFALHFFWQSYKAKSNWMLVALVGWGGVVTSGSGFFSSPQAFWVYLWIPTFFAIIESRRNESLHFSTVQNECFIKPEVGS